MGIIFVHLLLFLMLYLEKRSANSIEHKQVRVHADDSDESQRFVTVARPRRKYYT